jgi:hypothetical protein
MVAKELVPIATMMYLVGVMAMVARELVPTATISDQLTPKGLTLLSTTPTLSPCIKYGNFL